ncbi:MAG: DUF4198 domain-containing protein [Desulfovibrio sp.]|nr:DUF4198 domain-containing protein [Desulfovibrio sp.]
MLTTLSPAYRNMAIQFIFLITFIGIMTCWSSSRSLAQVTLLIPSQPSIEKPSPVAPTGKVKQPSSQSVPAPLSGSGETRSIAQEVDVLITMMRPFLHQGLPMDMPQLFAVLRYDAETPVTDGLLQPERRDLLGDVEEILYLEQKAWGANVALDHPGLHHFIIEARPWWDAARQRFIQHYVKTTVPVYGIDRGWHLPAGQRMEILPLTRPFGLTVPVLFLGRAVRSGNPMADVPVRMLRINTDKRTAPTPWHEELVGRTDGNGQFSFVLHQPGWWCCQATVEGAPLKGPDGHPRPLELSALFWLYVDSPVAAPGKR